MTRVSTTDLLRIRAALVVGVPPAQALGTTTGAAIAGIARQVALGLGLAEAARGVDSASEALGAGPVLRALALAERGGHGAVDAVDVALATRHEALVDEQRLAARSAQATGTARLLALLPLAAWALLLLLDPSALAFYAMPLGWVCGIASVALAAGAHLWSRRLVERASRAAALTDPLASGPTRFDPTRAAAAAGPVLIAALLVAGPGVALPVTTVVAAVAGRPRTAAKPPPIGVLELVALLRMLLGSGTALPAALEHLAAVTPTPLDTELRGVARRLRAGDDIESAFASTGLAEVGAVLGVTERWGVATAEPLRLLGDAISARQRAAAETAAERVQLALVFPTTMLTLPAFVIAVVPPLVWTALAT